MTQILFFSKLSLEFFFYQKTYILGLRMIPILTMDSPGELFRRYMVDFGFCVLDNKQEDVMPHSLMKEIKEISETYFDLGQEEKVLWHVSKNGGRGYFSSQDYHEINKDPNGLVLKDYKSGFFFGSRTLNHFPNLYANQTDGNLIEEYMTRCVWMCQTLLSEKLDIHHIRYDDPVYMMKFLKYPKGGVTDAHTDFGCLTLLHTTGPGLEIFINETWVPIDVPRDCFVVNTGDFLSCTTENRFKSTIHRVLHTQSSSPRYSIPFFFHANANQTVFSKDHRQETTLSFLNRRFDQTYHYRHQSKGKE